MEITNEIKAWVSTTEKYREVEGEFIKLPITSSELDKLYEKYNCKPNELHVYDIEAAMKEVPKVLLKEGIPLDTYNTIAKVLKEKSPGEIEYINMITNHEDGYVSSTNSYLNLAMQSNYLDIKEYRVSQYKSAYEVIGEEEVHELGEIPEEIHSYIDYGQYGRDHLADCDSILVRDFDTAKVFKLKEINFSKYDIKEVSEKYEKFEKKLEQPTVKSPKIKM